MLVGPFGILGMAKVHAIAENVHALLLNKNVCFAIAMMATDYVGSKDHDGYHEF